MLAPGVPGDIVAFNMGGKTIFAQSGAYIAGSLELELSTKGSLKAMFSGEGLVCNFCGPGKLWLQTRNLKGFAQLIAKLMPKQR